MRLRMPQAFHSGCAVRARPTAARTSVGPALSSSPRTSPVAGFTEAMRETTNSTSVAIWEEVYAGRNGRATVSSTDLTDRLDFLGTSRGTEVRPWLAVAIKKFPARGEP